ncbi:MAG: hypothetical protein P1P78_10025 [Methyloprofundus sp.]|nr:hypothetical protein [Methyloprofundus sp.]
MKPNFKLQEGGNQEIQLKLTYENKEFLIKFDVFAQEIDLLEVGAGEFDITELLSDETLNNIKEKIINQLKKEDQQNYSEAMAA